MARTKQPFNQSNEYDAGTSNVSEQDRTPIESIDDYHTSTANDVDGADTDPFPQPRKRRPRTPKQPATTAPTKKVAINRKSLATQLSYIHAMAAKMTGLAVLQLHDIEATELANGIGGVLDEYQIAPSPKALAWSGLFAALASVYIPRYQLIQQEIAERKTQLNELTRNNNVTL